MMGGGPMEVLCGCGGIERSPGRRLGQGPPPSEGFAPFLAEAYKDLFI